MNFICAVIYFCPIMPDKEMLTLSTSSVATVTATLSCDGLLALGHGKVGCIRGQRNIGFN